MKKRILFTLSLILLISLMILGCWNFKLIKENRDLKEQVKIQHNNYVECMSRSIEDKWLVEQFREMMTREEQGNYNE